MILFSSKIDVALSQKFYLFDLNVLVNGKNSVLPCELFTQRFSNEVNYFPIFCYSNEAKSNITFFETTETFDNKCSKARNKNPHLPKKKFGGALIFFTFIIF